MVGSVVPREPEKVSVPSAAAGRPPHPRTRKSSPTLLPSSSKRKNPSPHSPLFSEAVSTPSFSPLKAELLSTSGAKKCCLGCWRPSAQVAAVSGFSHCCKRKLDASSYPMYWHLLMLMRGTFLSHSILIRIVLKVIEYDDDD